MEVDETRQAGVPGEIHHSAGIRGTGDDPTLADDDVPGAPHGVAVEDGPAAEHGVLRRGRRREEERRNERE